MITLIDYLNNKYKTNGDVYSHLSFKGGKWLIPNDELDDFYIKYYKKIKQDEDLSLIEKINSGEIFKLFFDLEIPKNLMNKEQEFNLESKNFEIILNAIKKTLKELIINEKSSEDFIITERKISKNISKIHLNFYNISVNSSVCEGLIKKIHENLNDKIEYTSIIDQSVYKTGLRMFYSKKSDKEIEKEIEYLKKLEIYDENYYDKIYKYKNELTFEMFKKLCIKTTVKKMTEFKEEFKDYIKNAVKIKKDNKGDLKIEIKESINIEIEKLLNYLITLENFKDYNLQPIKIVSNINNNNFMCFYVTCENNKCPFKQRAHTRVSNPVYLELNQKGVYMRCYDAECANCLYPTNTKENLWKNIKQNIDIKNLTENLEVNYIKTEKSENISEKQRELLEKSIQKQTHFSVAKSIENIYNNFRVDSLKSMEWYKFNDIRFVKSDEIDECISDDFVKFYESMKINDSTKYTDIADYVNNENKVKNKYNQSIDRLILKLEDVGFKNKVKQQLATILYNKDSEFYSKLNTNPYLIGFNNGILDLKRQEFRKGKQCDYITFNTKIDFVEYDENNENVKEIYEFFSKIITNPKILEYLLLVLGKSLEGIPDEKFYIWTGLAGANGKSTLINFIESTLGDYHYSPDISLLTEKRRASGNASPDLFMIKGRRYLTFQEPENTDRLRTGILKQYSGGDTIIARELFKSPIEFKNQGTMILCCNDLPEINSLDGGTWRRVRVIKFNSRFVENPKLKNEFKIDTKLKEKMERWRPYFMSILYHYYQKYKKQGKIEEPEEILIATDKYKQNEDIYINFIKTKLVFTGDKNDYIKTSDIYSLFVEEWKDKNPETKWIPKQKDVLNAITRTFNIENDYSNEVSDNVFFQLTYK
jgi:P4 family phage/plasmid primase-like protien